MALVEMKVRSEADVHEGVIAMKFGNGSMTPCATANNGEICINATATGCALLPRNIGAIVFRADISCPDGLGEITVLKPEPEPKQKESVAK